MIVKLKTLEQLIEEFGFEEEDGGLFKTKYKNYKWVISDLEMKYLGKEIEVENIGFVHSNYTHVSNKEKTILGWHELWFEPVEFIDESEFKI